MSHLLKSVSRACKYSTTFGPGVGYDLRHDVSWLKRDVLLFAVSIGCKSADELHFLYEGHPKFAVFPTYSTVLPFKKTSQEIIDYYNAQESIVIPGVPKFDSRRVLDGHRLLQLLRPLPPTSQGRNFELRSRVLGVYDKGKPGSVVETEHSIADKETGEIFTRSVGSKFFVGQGEWGGPRGPSMVKYPPPKGKENSPDNFREIKLAGEVAHLYRLNGDYNPLHATPEAGQKLGFGGLIMHGLCSWNASAHALLRELGGSDPSNIKEFGAKFSAPAKPGVKLVVKMWKTGNIKDGFEEIIFVTEADGKAVLTDGRALIKCVE